MPNHDFVRLFVLGRDPSWSSKGHRRRSGLYVSRPPLDIKFTSLSTKIWLGEIQKLTLPTNNPVVCTFRNSNRVQTWSSLYRKYS